MSAGGDRRERPVRNRDYDAGFAAGVLFSAQLAEVVAESVSGAASTKRANGAAFALDVFAEELRRCLSAGEASAPSIPKAPLPSTSPAASRTEARLKGYVGEACPDCANFTLVRNGTCLKCETCGSTTGCS